MSSLVALLSPFPLALMLAPACRRFALALSIIDRPRGDRFHHRATPKLGGLVIALALLPLIFALERTGRAYPPLILGGALAFLTGILDDLRPLRARLKLLLQLGAAAVSTGLILQSPGEAAAWTSALPTPALWLGGVVWIVALQNALNFLDNMDGIAAGVGGIGLAALSLHVPPGGPRELALGLALACAGFLPWNTTRPSRLFLGDAGSLPLGHALGVLSLHAVLHAPTVGPAAAVVVALAIPLLDISFVTITRLRRGQSPAIGGRDHTTHRVYARVESVAVTRTGFWAVALALGLLSLGMRDLSPTPSLAILALVVGLAVGAGWAIARLPLPSEGERN